MTEFLNSRIQSTLHSKWQTDSFSFKPRNHNFSIA